MDKGPADNQNVTKRTSRWRIALLVLGWFLVIISPIIGALPGPGFLILFPLGLAIILKNSLWAKKRYSRFSKTHPEYGRWTNWALRRKKQGTRPPVPPLKRDLMRFFRISRS